MFSVTHIHKIICTKILQILLSVVDMYRKCNKVTQDAGLKIAVHCRYNSSSVRFLSPFGRSSVHTRKVCVKSKYPSICSPSHQKSVPCRGLPGLCLGMRRCADVLLCLSCRDAFSSIAHKTWLPFSR